MLTYDGDDRTHLNGPLSTQSIGSLTGEKSADCR